MFNAESVELSVSGNGTKYQRAGVSEKVVVTEFTMNDEKTSIKFKTTNENGEEGNSKFLSLSLVAKEGAKCSAWTVTAEHLVKLIMAATGKTVEDAKEVLNAKDQADLLNKLSKTLVGQPFRGLFGTKESTNGKTYVELYAAEPVGGTRLTYDPNNTSYNKKANGSTTSVVTATAGDNSSLPF